MSIDDKRPEISTNVNESFIIPEEGDLTGRILKESNSRKYRSNTMKRSKNFKQTEMRKAIEIQESYSLEKIVK